MYQFVVRSSTPTSSEALNIWNSDHASAQEAAEFLHVWYSHIRTQISDDAVFAMDPTAREVNEVTGVTVGLVPVNWGDPVAGTGVGLRGADATAALVAHDTGVFHAGRRIQGRTFLPYPSISVLGEGQISVLALTAFQDLLDLGLPALTNGGFGIWRRPVNGAGGVLAPISSSVARREYSYIGNRRN
jgi:hypothetical protein